MEQKHFATMRDGREAKIYRLRNPHGMIADVTDLGATLVSLQVPDSNGNLIDVVLGYEKGEMYETEAEFYGGTIGRVANRIAGGQFILNGKTYQVPQNDFQKNSLHSDPNGFQTKLWSAEWESTQDSKAVTFYLTSEDGDHGFPGNAQIEVTYRLTCDNELMIEYHSICDEDTPMNLTNHSYFNLNGEGSGTILKHELQILADEFNPTDCENLVTGETKKVENTNFDFRKAREIGERMDFSDEQISFGQGYDHNFIVNGNQVLDTAEKIAFVRGDISKIVMEVYSDLPGIQFYSGGPINYPRGKNGKTYSNFAGFCLETQYAPNSMNEKNFVSCILKKNEDRKNLTVYRFITE